ncbi:lipoprotein 17-related variable surface protein [Malacoplasma iowae]|uniref:lipoprotein 17-related variable surface protein n=1 Tax=Malacoplasma iowae TaxID=2116 RepID=UPI0038739F7C|nr:lipoprotein 17-related variable surface protein [Malacoplasma iowae]
MKKNKITLSVVTTLSLGIIGASSLVSFYKESSLSKYFYNENNNKVDNTESSNSDANENINKNNVEPTPFDFVTAMPLVSQSTGPIVIRKSTIYSLDWFGSQRWKLDLNTAKFNGQSVLPEGLSNSNHIYWRDSVVINYALDSNTNTLWVLTNATNPSGKPTTQNLVSINSINGEIKGFYSLNNNITDQYSAQYGISVLQNGNVLIYNDGANRWWRNQIFDVEKLQALPYKENQNSKSLQDDLLKFNDENGIGERNIRTNFIFSVGENKNIMIMTNLGDNQNDTGNRNSVWFAFVDDEMNRIISDQNDILYKPVLISERIKINADTNMKNGESFPKLTYTLADGRILFCIYDKLFVFFPNEMKGQKDLKYKMFNIGLGDGNGKYYPVESWTTDTDNNVYVKYANSGTINKFTFTGTTSSNTEIQTSTYFNLSGIQQGSIANQKIFDNAKNFVLYNVYGYTGQIMLLNPYRVTDLTKIPDKFEDEATKNNDYGLAVAIVNNKNSVGGGDLKGLLNTENAFLKSSDFVISENILKNKLPSEINRSDIEITENGFFTKNNSTDSQGNLLYPQFKKVMDDEKSKTPNLKITVNIDQIPWFVDNGIMPENIPPLNITKEFTTDQKIQDRVIWKNENLDYDFKNTLPTKVTLDDVKRFDPFSINLTSQITTIKGENYPKKEYKIKSFDDNNGKIEISMEYSYLPIGVEVNEENIMKSTFTHEYTIFKKDGEKDFIFVGNNNSSENINTIPQLKELSQSNLLPSSITANDLNGILRFINTDSSAGYPISKMKFNIEPNDDLGSLKITGTLPSDYYGDGEKTFTKTYTGLNKKSDYKFIFNDQPTGFIKKNFRPSEVKEQDIYNSFVTYSGYNSSDLSLNLNPNNETGELNVEFILDGKYPDSIANGVNGFIKKDNYFVFSKTISGFKTNKEYETEYQVNFISDDDKSLDEIKKYTPNQIKQSINSQNSNSSVNENPKLTINGQQINSEKDLAISVIKSLGTNLPKKEELTDDNFGYNIYYNDPNGEITVKLTFKNITGVSGDLVFIQRFTGFAKGNQVTTDDILSFKTQTKLMSDNPTFKTTLPSDLAKLLNANDEKRVEEIKKYISYFSGDYSTAINANKFKLEITSDDIYGYLTIKIIFDRQDIKNQESLLSYTVTYNGFATE